MRIPKRIYEELVAHAREEAPNECCGLIGGSNGEAKTLYRARNAEASPLRYNLDPQDQFRIMTEMEERGEQLSAIYHSHTHTEAYPSSTDVNLAANTATVTFNFSEAPTDFSLANTSATGGSLSALHQVSATQYTAIFTAGLIYASDAGAAHDLPGNEERGEVPHNVRERRGAPHDLIADFRGLARSHPGLAAAMAIFMLSLTGVPPLAGFVGKFYIFSAALNAGLIRLVVIAVLNSVVSAYYYVRVIVAMYMQEGGVTVERIGSRPGLLVSVVIAAIAVIIIGLFPQPYMTAATDAYAAAGVDIDATNRSSNCSNPLAAGTARPLVLARDETLEVVNAAVVAPIPTAAMATAVMANPGLRRSVRAA